MNKAITEKMMNEILERSFNQSFLTDSVNESLDEIKSSLKDSVAVNDSYGNKLLSIGNDDKSAEYDKYNLSNSTLNWPLWTALYNDSWVFKRAIDKPAQDEIRCGITLHGKSDKFEVIYRRLRHYRHDFINLLKWGALYGGAVAVMMFDNLDDEDYKVKLNIKKVKDQPMTLYVVDRWYGVAPALDKTVTKMSDPDFGKPKYYDITLADGHTITVHHSYVLRYEHRDAPQFVKRGMLQGWGYAEGSHILNELARDDKLKSSIQSLVDKSLIEIIKMAGMRGVFMGADTQNEEQLTKRLEMVNWGRNFNSLTFLDKDDEYQQHNFSGLGGLSDILQQNMWQISSALEMQGILFGDLKGGFSNDESALERYDETINNRCEDFLRPIYEKFLAFLFAVEDINEKVEFEFNSLQMNKQDKDTLESLENFANVCQKYQDMGVLDASQIAKALVKYSTKHIVDFDLDEDAIKKIAENEQNSLEGINLDGE